MGAKIEILLEKRKVFEKAVAGIISR